MMRSGTLRSNVVFFWGQLIKPYSFVFDPDPNKISSQLGTEARLGFGLGFSSTLSVGVDADSDTVSVSSSVGLNIDVLAKSGFGSGMVCAAGSL